MAARTALAGVTEDENLPDYVKAREAVEAAKQANDAAKAAETSDMAERYQMAAEDALADARMYTALVMRIETARADAQTALDAAKSALAAVEANKDVDLPSFTRAEDAVADAEAANERAKAATTAEAAEAAQADTETARDKRRKVRRHGDDREDGSGCGRGSGSGEGGGQQGGPVEENGHHDGGWYR